MKLKEDEYTISEVAQILDVSTSTVRRRIKNGKLKANKRDSVYGPTYFIPQQEINKAVATEEVALVEQKMSKEDIRKAVVEAINSHNRGLIEGITDNINKKIDKQQQVLEEQQETIKQQTEAINELTKEVRKIKEENSKSAIAKFFEWLYY